MKSAGLLKEVFLFLKETKRWWLAPIVIVLVLLTFFIVLTESGGAVLPFIYTLF